MGLWWGMVKGFRVKGLGFRGLRVKEFGVQSSRVYKV